MALSPSPKVYLHHGSGSLDFSANNGATWVNRQTGGVIAYVVDFTDIDLLHRVRSLGALGKEPLQKSSDGGVTFASVGVTMPRNVPQNNRALVKLSSQIFIASATPEAALGDSINSNIIQRTTNEGATWSVVVVEATTAGFQTKAFSLIRNPNVSGTAFLICFDDIAGTTADGLYRTLNSGASWSKVFSLGSDGLNLGNNYAIRGPFITASGSILAVVVRQTQSVPPFDFRVFRSTNNGTSFSQVLQDTLNGLSIDANASVHSNFCQLPTTNRIWVGGWYRSDDDGLTWIFDDTLPGNNADGNAYSGGAIYIARDDVNLILRSTDGSIFADMPMPTSGGRINEWLSTETVVLGPPIITPRPDTGRPIEIAGPRWDRLRENYRPIVRIY